MYYVYILKSLDYDETYIGYTKDLKTRVTDHNFGKSKHTRKYKPWEVLWYCAFEDKERAVAFEKYLKTGSGKAFASKRLFS